VYSRLYSFSVLHATTDASKALLDDPQYIKALQRRASSTDKLDTWSSLTAAQEGRELYVVVGTLLRERLRLQYSLEASPL